MQIALLTTSEALDTIRRRLMNGWVIVDGDPGALGTLEETVYPPGTPLNAGYEIIGFLPSVHLAKKTDRLRALLGDPSDFDTIIVLTFGALPDGSPGAAIDSYDPDVLTQKRAVDQVVARARSVLESGRRARCRA